MINALKDAYAQARTFTGEDWLKPDRSLLLSGQSPAPTLPIGAFGPFGPWIENAARAASAPVDYVAFGFATCAAALVGNARAVQPDPSHTAWDEPLALWTGLVGPPSSGKSPALKPFERLMDAIEAADREAFEPMMQECLSRKIIAEEVEKDWQSKVAKAAKNGDEPPPRPPEANPPPVVAAPRTIVRSATLEALARVLAHSPKGVVQLRDELAGWMNDMTRYSASSDRPHWLSMYSGGIISMDRVKFGDEPLRVPSALASVLGGIQPDRLAECLEGPDDGFNERFILIWPDPQPPVRSKARPDMEHLRRVFDRLHSLQMSVGDDGKLKPVAMPFEPKAADTFFLFRETTYDLATRHDGPLGGWIGKGNGMVARLAGLFTLLDWAVGSSVSAPERIGEGAVERACQLWTDYLLPMAKRAFGDAVRPEAERLACRLLKEIRTRSASVVNERAVYKDWKPHNLREAAKVKAAFKFLEEAGWTRPKPTRAGDTAGRGRADWEINPELWA